jgi:Xaa-Pro aminopeptidase
MDLSAIQSALQERNIDAWLFYDHHYRDPIGYRILGLSEHMHVTRRWYYVVPAKGEPRKLVHRIEAGHLDPLPGEKLMYSSWQEQHENLKSLVAPYKTIAMQYSPNNSIPYIGLVDAGTVELLRSFGKEIVSSGDLVSRFEATLTPEQIESHLAAGRAIDSITESAFKEIGRRVNNGGTNEYDIQKFILEAYSRENLITDNPPIVGVNANSGNPHYGTSKDGASPIKKGDFVLLDIWAKQNKPNAVFYDITWTGVVGTKPTGRQQEIFNIVRTARDAGFARVQTAMDTGTKIAGWQVDEATRDSIKRAGYEKYFVHRTGHSIGVDIHANGANMDNLETKDEREIIPNTLFSVEPGLYFPEFGVRSEFDVLVRNGKAEVTGRIQKELVLI